MINRPNGQLKNANYAIINSKHQGPLFGAGHDWHICGTMKEGGSALTSTYSSFTAPKDDSLLAGKRNFIVQDLEVFHVQ